MGRESNKLIVRYLQQYVDEEYGGKIILKFIFVFKNPKCLINNNSMCLFKRHKPSPRPNTINLTNVKGVTSCNYFDHDTEVASVVRLLNLYIT